MNILEDHFQIPDYSISNTLIIDDNSTIADDVGNKIKDYNSLLCSYFDISKNGDDKKRIAENQDPPSGRSKLAEMRHDMAETEKEIEKKRGTARKEVSERDNELKEKIKELKDLEREIADPVSSREVRAASQKLAQKVANEARIMRDGVLDFARKREMQLMEMSKRKRGVILEEIQLAVSKHSSKEGYDLVFDKSARGTKGISFLLYSKDARDFSSKMILELNGE